LVIDDLYGYFTAYPFEEKAYFKSSDSTLQSIWEVGWRTLRLCAGETFYDCPYYEQLQYVGDNHIEAMVSLYVSGDDRLMRNSIEQFYNSQLPSGLTQSRYPSYEPQVIPTFSLLWINMIHDYWMHRDDPAFVKKYLNGIRNVLYWYQQQIDKNGMLGSMDWWNFVDWAFGPWNGDRPIGGTPPGAIDGNSSIITLLYAYTLEQAGSLFAAFGDTVQANDCRELSRSLVQNTYQLCWSQEKGLIADTPDQSSFSQHANIMAVLAGMFKEDKEKIVMQKVLTSEDLVETAFNFKFFLVRAIVKAGMADRYLSLLGPWKTMIDLGLTTFAETPEPTRSDCHAWSAHPNYDLLATVCGIAPASPGFKSVNIEPHLGSLKFVECKMPHPKGDIFLRLKKKKKEGIEGEIILPEGLSGTFRWKDQKLPLQTGRQKVNM